MVELEKPFYSFLPELLFDDANLYFIIRYNSYNMPEALARSHIHLNRKVLANLAIWEPRSFRSVCAITAFKENQSFEEGGLQTNHPGPGVDVITEGKL